jgi:hypothetical protein
VEGLGLEKKSTPENIKLAALRQQYLYQGICACYQHNHRIICQCSHSHVVLQLLVYVSSGA